MTVAPQARSIVVGVNEKKDEMIKQILEAQDQLAAEDEDDDDEEGTDEA